MKFTYVAENNFRALTVIAKLMTLWPMEINASKKQIAFDWLLWCYWFGNYLIMIWSCIGTFLVADYNAFLILNNCIEIIAVSEGAFRLLVCKLHRSRLQKLLNVCQNFISCANPNEYLIMHKYSKQHLLTFSVFSGIMLFICMTINILSPVVFSKLPTASWNYYSINSTLTWIFLYIHQSTVIIHFPSIVVVDIIILLLLYVPTAKLELLQQELERVKNHSELVKCIHKHQNINRFVIETNEVVGLLILSTLFSTGGYALTAGLQIIRNISGYAFVHFTGIISTSIFRVYMYAFIAEAMTALDTNLGMLIYFSNWYNESKTMISMKMIMIYKCQKPLTISVLGLFDYLGVKFFAKFLYCIFSYIMALRTVTNSWEKQNYH